MAQEKDLGPAPVITDVPWIYSLDRTASMTDPPRMSRPVRITGGTRAPAVASPRVQIDITLTDMLHAVRNWMRPRMLSDYGFTYVRYAHRADFELGLGWDPSYDERYAGITIITDGQPDDWNGDLVESMRRAEQLFRDLSMAVYHSRRAY